MTELASLVRRRAEDCCEYCRFPERAFRRPFHIEHIVAKQHGGATDEGNLALACWTCNWKKGPNLTGLDPATGEIATLFHPRKQAWTEHFRDVILIGDTPSIEIQGLTPTGRATARLLGFNEEIRPALRYELAHEALYMIRK